MRRGLRLFECFQQRIGSLIVHIVGVFYDKDTRGAFKRTEISFAFQLAHWLDPNDLLEWPHHCEVGVLAPDEPLSIVVVAAEWRERRARDSLTGRALVTGFKSIAMTTVQDLGQLEREELLAYPFIAGEEHRARNPAAGKQAPERLFYFVIPDECGKHFSNQRAA